MELRATGRDIAIIVLRCLSIYSFVKATELLSDKFAYFFIRENYTFVKFIQIMGPSAILVACGVIIWLVSPAIASRMLMGRSEDEKHAVSLNNIQNLVFSAMGLFLIVTVIPEIVNRIGFLYAIAFYSTGAKGVAYATEISYLISLLIELSLGIWLLVGVRRIGKIIRALQGEQNQRFTPNDHEGE
jgi:hypothetical protein